MIVHYDLQGFNVVVKKGYTEASRAKNAQEAEETVGGPSVG